MRPLGRTEIRGILPCEPCVAESLASRRRTPKGSRERCFHKKKRVFTGLRREDSGGVFGQVRSNTREGGRRRSSYLSEGSIDRGVLVRKSTEKTQLKRTTRKRRAGHPETKKRREPLGPMGRTTKTGFGVPVFSTDATKRSATCRSLAGLTSTHAEREREPPVVVRASDRKYFRGKGRTL